MRTRMLPLSLIIYLASLPVLVSPYLLTRIPLLSATTRSTLIFKDIKLQNVFLYRTVVQEG